MCVCVCGAMCYEECVCGATVIPEINLRLK